MNLEKRGSIPTELMQAIVNYLETKPFKEVGDLLIGPDGIAKNFKPISDDKPKEVADGEIRTGAE